MNSSGEMTMLFDRQQLVIKLEENRARHKEIFDDAMEGYSTALLTKAQEIVDVIKRGDLSEAYSEFYKAYQLPRPEDHTKDYDAILEMLGMTTEPTIELGETDFRMYVRDEWTWKAKFVASTQMYNSRDF